MKNNVIAYSVERIAYSKNKNPLFSYRLSAIRYPCLSGRQALSAKNGFTLAELMVVVGIFAGIFAMIMTVLTNSDQSFRLGQDKLAQQQEARKAMDSISGLLRQSNPVWVINGTSYPVTVSEANTRIDFYHPVFDADGNIASLKKITFKLDPSNNERLLKKEGTADELAIAHNVSYLSFGGGCGGCGSFNCTSVADDCPAVSIDVRTRKKNEFALSSQVSLRNQNVTLSSEVEIEEPLGGEF